MAGPRSTPTRRSRVGRRSITLVSAMLLVLALIPAAAGAQDPDPTDPRVGLEPGFADAGVAAEGLDLIGRFAKEDGTFFDPANVGSFAFANSDLAFTGDHVIMGNFAGFQIFDVSDPANPTLRTEVYCPGGQHDPTVIGDLLFISVESAAARVDCGDEGAGPLSEPNPDRFRGIRIFDISDLDDPKQVGMVQTCRGSHTHRLVEDLDDPSRVYIYNNGTAGVRSGLELEGCQDDALTDEPFFDEASSRWKIEIIEVPVAAPAEARIVKDWRLFRDEDTGALNGLNNTLPCGAPGSPITNLEGCDEDQIHPAGGQRYSPLPNTNTCHDITVYPEVGLAAGACQGNGILIDISDPAEPVRLDAVADPNFSYWHSANFNNDGTSVMFTDEWGGGTGARCRATDQLSWGANALFRIVDGPDGKQLEFTSYYKMPAVQTDTENCVAHQANIVPVPGRDILVQAWYQGGISMLDWTDPANPYEIGYFDRGPIDEAALVLGGHWSGYWYNGSIYGSEIARGLDVLDMTPTAHLTANEIAAANTVRLDEHNAMSMRRITWEPSFPLSKAYLDQMVRDGVINSEVARFTAEAIQRAENMAGRGQNRAAALQLQARAAWLNAHARIAERTGTGGDPVRLRQLATSLTDLAATLR
jgi:hypothetical protein